MSEKMENIDNENNNNNDDYNENNYNDNVNDDENEELNNENTEFQLKDDFNELVENEEEEEEFNTSSKDLDFFKGVSKEDVPLSLFLYKYPKDVSLKGEDGLLKHTIGKKLQEKNIKFNWFNQTEGPVFIIVFGLNEPESIKEIYNVIDKRKLVLENGVVQNMIYLYLQEVEDKDKCDHYKTSKEDLTIIKLFLNKDKNKGGKRQFMDCIPNKIHLENITTTIQSFYELKLKNVEESKLEDENLEEEEKIDSKIFSSSVILRLNDHSTLALKDPSAKIKIMMNRFSSMMNQYPVHTKKLCGSLFDLLSKEEKMVYIEESKAIYNDVYLYQIGKEDDLNQFSIKVSNHYYQKNKKVLDKYINDNLNKHKNNLLQKYLITKEYIKTNPNLETKLFNFDITNSQMYPSYGLEDILLNLIAQKKQELRILIPMFTHLHYFNNNHNNSDPNNKSDYNSSKFFLISYLLFDNKRIYLYPLHLIDLKNPIQNNEKMEKIRKNVINDLGLYINEVLKSSVLSSFVKIQYGGTIDSFQHQSLILNDLPSNMNHFLIIFFQLFYTLLNKDIPPNEVLSIFPVNDLNDHFYIFLQFIQETCYSRSK